MLLERSKDKEWADIETLKWESGGEKAENAIPIEEFCRYKYIIYTEGITYSGRLPFHQACESIILTPPLTYFLHTTHLVRPLHSRTLPLSTKSTYNTITADRWPSYAASEANMIFVAPDWADLEETIEYLRANSDVAKGIARRQRELVTEMGYLSPAAEACYWRALMRGWASVVRTEEVKGWEEEGVRFETFVLRGEVGWE